MKNLNAYLDSLFQDKFIHNVAVRVGKGDQILCDLYRSSEGEINQNTLFDMASVTKIVATSSLCFIAMDRGLISLSDKVSKFFDCPDDKKDWTIFHLMTHTIGIGHKPLDKDDVTYSNVADRILSIPLDVPVGSDVLYSCPGYILLGKILEKVFGERLDLLFKKLVAEPLGMNNSSFLPDRSKQIVNSNREECDRGVVNDYNCQHLGGVAGNAGLFSNVADLTLYAKMLIAKGAPIIKSETILNAAKNHTEGMSSARGIGFVYVDKDYALTGGLMPVGSVGHGGHTGQSIFVDIKSGLYCIALTDCTISVIKTEPDYYYYEKVKEVRQKMNEAIKLDLNL